VSGFGGVRKCDCASGAGARVMCGHTRCAGMRAMLERGQRAVRTTPSGSCWTRERECVVVVDNLALDTRRGLSGPRTC
jgi:carbonic anhydrase